MAGAAQASIVTYTSQSSYLAAISAPGVETFNNLPLAPVNSPLTRAAGAYGYTATAASGFYPAGTVGDVWLSTDTAHDPINFNAFTGGVFGFGGFFFDSDINGNFLAGDITISATDAGGTTSQTIFGATTSSFLGFVSDTGITSASVTSVQAANPAWPTINNLTLGAAVPEPGIWAMMLLGMGLVGASLRRRKLAASFA